MAHTQTTRLLGFCLSLLFAVSCGDTADPTADDPGAVGDSETGQTDLPDTTQPEDIGPRDYLAVVRTFNFAREERGVTVGFDLDGVISTASDPQGCNQVDLRTEDGERGIDNQFAKLIPAVETVGGDAIEGLANEAINDGRLLLMIGLEGVDDLVNDDDVTVRVFRGLGQPAIGTHGLLEPGQTFDRDDEVAEGVHEHAQLVDGVVEAGPLDVVLQLQVFFFHVEFLAEDALIRFEVHEDGTFTGYMSGAIDINQIIDVASTPGTGTVGETIILVVQQMADLAPDDDGDCQEISFTVLFESVSAFLFEDAS